MLANSNKKISNNNIDKNQGNIIEFPEKNIKEKMELKESEVIIKRNPTTENRYSSAGENNSKITSSKSNIVKFEKNKNQGNGNNLPPKPTIIAILGIAIIAFAIWGFTNKNAQEIFVGEKSIGIISDKNITTEELTKTALAKLKENLGTDVQVNEEITLKPIHASKKEIVSTEYALSEITKNYTFQVGATAILVDNKEIAVVKNEEEAKSVLSSIASKYITEGATQVSEPTFLQNVELKEKFVLEEDITESATAISLLDVNTEQGQKYSIKSGDTLYGIAINADMTMEELLKLNPGLTENSMLKIGQEINLVVPVPLLSVITYEQAVYTEAIPKTTETINNNNEYKTYRKVISAGKDGSKEVTAKITKINGVEDSREIISEKVLAEPTVEKVEVGTLNTPPKKAIGSFAYPVSGARISSVFGKRWGTMHKGVDFACAYGTPIKASDGGTVVYSGWGNGYGNMVKIDHGNGFYTVYGHNSKNVVSVGQKVAQGEVIGYVGSTGNSTGNHVHFEIIKNGVNENPLNYLK
ncbi:MAG: M23 family metallopeptidase, partial [Eubacteriales bacterium]|nr:M23 family metallopeptidase [Eubacteriales bacterium]